MFPIAWASEFGIELSQCETREGMAASGKTNYFVWPPGIQAVFMGKTFKLAGMFGGTTHVLLGRRDFFVHFDVTFHEKDSIFTIAPT